MQQVWSIGEKIRRIRKALRMTQPELGKEVITADRICKIERGETTHIKKTDLEFLCIQFELKIKELIKTNKHIPKLVCDFSLSWLLESESSQAEKIILKNMESKKIDCKMIQENLKLSKKYKLKNIEIQIYKMAVEYFYKKSQFKLSCNYAHRGYKIIGFNDNNLNEKHFFVEYMSRNYVRLENWIDALTYLNLSKDILKELNCTSDEEKNNLYYNYSLVHKNLKDVQTAGKYLKKIKPNILSKSKKIDVEIQLAVLKIQNNEINEAIKDFQRLIFLEMNDIPKAVCYGNLSECYYVKEEYKKAQEYIDKCIEILRTKEEAQDKYIEYLQLGSKIYCCNNLQSEAEKLLLKRMNVGNDSPVDEIINFYIDTKQSKKILEFQYKNHKKVKNETIIHVIEFFNSTDSKNNEKFLKKCIENNTNVIDKDNL